MKPPKPGETATIEVTLTCNEYELLADAAAQIDGITRRKNAAHVTRMLDRDSPAERVRFNRRAAILARFVQEEIIEG
jgi:hypothetical protein